MYPELTPSEFSSEVQIAMAQNMDNLLIRYAYESKLYGFNDKVILAGTPLSEDEHQLFGSITRRLVDLVFYAFEKRYGADHLEFGRGLGKSEELIKLLLSLSPGIISSSILARADIVRTAEGFKLIELNLGSQIGGMYYGSLPRLVGFAQQHDVLKGWCEYVLNRLDEPGSMVFTDSVAGVKWMSPYCKQLSRELALHTGVETPLVSCEAFIYRGGKLYAGGREVKVIYSWLSDLEWYLQQPQTQPLIRALQDGCADLLMSPLAPVFADKGLFSMLWQMCQEGSLSVEQSAFLHAYVPFTQSLECADSHWLHSEQKRLVIKPTDGYGGHGVVVGSEVTAKTWQALIKDRLLQFEEKRYVVQLLAPALPQQVRVGCKSGSSSNAESHVVWGAFAQGDNYLGAYARSKPCSSSLVINQGNGAAVGSVTYL